MIQPPTPRGGVSIPPDHLARGLSVALEARVQRARENFNDFAEFVMRDPKGRPVSQESLHRVMHLHLEACWAAGKRAAVLAPFGHGKCQPSTAPVQMADGSVRPIVELVGREDRVLAFDSEDVCFRPSQGRAFFNGDRRVLRIKLLSGRSIDVTAEHPLWTVLGWRKAQDLQVGSFVASVGRMPDLGRQSLQPGEAKLLGYFVGDGGVAHRALFSCAASELLEDFGVAAFSMGFEVRRQGVSDDHYVRGARGWLRVHGLLGCTSHTKRTPEAIFKAPAADIAEYLGAYFACDGHVSTSRGGSVELYSVNKGLLLDVQSLLLRFGVGSRVRIKRGRYKGEVHLSWRLTITGASDLEAFRDRVTIPGSKGRLLGSRVFSTSNPNLEGIPLEYRALLRKTPHWHKRHTGVSLDQQSKWTTSRAVVTKAALGEGNQELMRVVSPALRWERVVGIEDLGKQPTYGLEVDRLHTYVSGDMVCHNTIQLTVGRLCWEIGKDPSLRAKIVSNNDGKAQERVMGCTALLFSPPYRMVFPNIRQVPQEAARKQKKPSKLTQHEIYLDRPGFSLDPTIQAAGITTGGTGGRADLMVFDDICDQKNSIDEPGMREKVIENMENVWLERCTPEARVWYVATPWHQADATHKLFENPAWSVLKCSISENFKQIDMEVYNPPPNYPLPAISGGAVNGSSFEARWVPLDSSNVRAARFDPSTKTLEVLFQNGASYRYEKVPRDLFQDLIDADSPGHFLNQRIKGSFRYQRLD